MRHAFTPTTSLLFAIFALTGCPEPEHPIYQCKSDTDCPGALRCSINQNICVEQADTCNDGVTQSYESCDPADDSVDLCPYEGRACNRCSDECTLIELTIPSCGDEILQSAHEECDEGVDPAQTCLYGATSCQVCSPECKLVAGLTSYCGDNQVDAANMEECDEGQNPNQTCPYGETSCQVCSPGCKRVAGQTSYCGDMLLDMDGREQCDDGLAPDMNCSYGELSCQVCTSNCTITAGTTRYCGDGMRSDGEQCDPGDEVNLDCPYGDPMCTVCNAQCQLIDGKDTGSCGDGIVQPAHETCDGAASIAAETCESVLNLAYGTVRCTNACDVDESQCFATTQLSLGGEHSCALLSTGAVRCWGQNQDGQLGVGTNISQNRPSSPVIIGGIATKIATGLAHTCALLDTHQVYCWGNNTQGQLGTGNEIPATTPQAVTGLPADITDITAGTFHTCALTNSGEVYCWGDNRFGQLGVSQTLDTDNRPLPELIPQKVNVNSVDVLAAGGISTCVIRNQQALCWGEVTFTGQGDPWQSVSISGANNMTSLSVGAMHACGITTTSELRCWGEGFMGQLGTGVQESMKSTSAKVVQSPQSNQPLNGILHVTTGDFHTCALRSTDQVFCWGANTQGQLGTNNTNGQDQLRPVLLPALSNRATRSLEAGTFHTCRTTEAGTVDCWGDNNFGQIGNGTQGPQIYTPTPTTGW